ncbi:hypothetical protein AVEN_42747-2 [Araneus ventricosus]|uniref:Uncharacterized protein n=1 Tax=Araneus ventricosus TaxID=182803 RepID=A0A4Y2AFR8_ARAVE|nr:hypothetical protein AVEN_42747-2 [Araneus ventricosus]
MLKSLKKTFFFFTPSGSTPGDPLSGLLGSTPGSTPGNPLSGLLGSTPGSSPGNPLSGLLASTTDSPLKSRMRNNGPTNKMNNNGK